ncbi:hypothetical protein LAV82_22675 [Bacillus sp. ILBB4]|nr:hypothetical protein [Bacillus sp. ILBB4]
MNSISTTRSNKVFCLIGPSGTGKDELKFNSDLPYLVFYLDRKMREGEVEGENGYFISPEEFEAKKKAGFFIAHDTYAGGSYGVCQGELLKLESSPVISIATWDIFSQIKESFDKMDGYSSNEVVSIFVHTPREDLKTRMIKQGRAKEEIRARIDRADIDYAMSSKCDYIIENLNGQFDSALYQLMKILVAESFGKKTA